MIVSEAYHCIYDMYDLRLYYRTKLGKFSFYDVETDRPLRLKGNEFDNISQATIWLLCNLRFISLKYFACDKIKNAFAKLTIG